MFAIKRAAKTKRSAEMLAVNHATENCARRRDSD
jgi:hypothetical protein